jgi:5-(aminomethyl)-3-furanmethanol phosphate kinase
MWVVKLGGSLANSEELARWLHVIATAGAGKVVLVPGGGPWADEVREAQKREGFDDRIAHRMALRAMEQYGRVLAATRPGFVVASSVIEIRKVLKDGQVPVWMPYEMVVADLSMPESWDVTSDSLSAWLAGQLKSPTLVLVKSVEVGEADANVIAARGLVDLRFWEYATIAGRTVRILGKSRHETLAEMLGQSVAGNATYPA